MKYGYVDPEDIARSFAFPLPSSAGKYTMQTSLVQQYVKDGVDPIQLSIKKWEGIRSIYDLIGELPNPYKYYASLYDHIGYKNCALCLASIIRHERFLGPTKFSTDKCKFCPLADFGTCFDERSAYYKVQAILKVGGQVLMNLKDEEHGKRHIELGKAIDGMVDSLHKLDKART